MLEKAGWGGDPEELFRAVEEGRFGERDFGVGGRLEWMAYRTPSRVDLMRDVRWAGEEPFAGFEIRLPWQGLEWVFLVPKACGNLALYCELSVLVAAGELERSDPGGEAMVVGAGGLQTFDAPCRTRGEARAGEVGAVAEVGAVTTVAVDEGQVEFQDYGHPIAVVLEGDDSVTASVTADGQLALAAPATNSGPLRLLLGNAEATLSPGGSLWADWILPVCALSVSPTSGFEGAELTFDAGGSSVSHGAIRSVELELTGPDGTTEILARERPDAFRWPMELAAPGTYRGRAVAISDLGKRSRNECSATFEVKRLPVRMVSFRAEPGGAEPGIVVRWETLREIAVAGYNVYRSRGGGEPVRVNPQPIAAWGPDAHGAVYELRDRPPAPGLYRYRLELVDDAGNVSPYGEPFELEVR